MTGIDQLDLGVYRVDRADGDSWVARLFPAAPPRERVDGDAAILSQARGRRQYDALRAAVDALDTGEGLPLAFTHPDFVMANVVAPETERWCWWTGRAPDEPHGRGRWRSCCGPWASAVTWGAWTASSTATAAGCGPSPRSWIVARVAFS